MLVLYAYCKGVYMGCIGCRIYSLRVGSTLPVLQVQAVQSLESGAWQCQVPRPFSFIGHNFNQTIADSENL